MPDCIRKSRIVLNEFFTTREYVSLNRVAEKHNTDVECVKEIINHWDDWYTVEWDGSGKARLTPTPR
jgi:hypothetical protein